MSGRIVEQEQWIERETGFSFKGTAHLLELAQQLVGNTNPNTASDLGVAVLNLMTCMKGAWLNVKINLPGVKDEALQAQFAKAEDMVAEAEALAKELYEGVRDSL